MAVSQPGGLSEPECAAHVRLAQRGQCRRGKAMSNTQLFRLGADVRCADQACGRLSSLVVSPGDDVVTHLVIEPPGKEALGRLVPFGLVDTAPSGSAVSQLRLRCPWRSSNGSIPRRRL